MAYAAAAEEPYNFTQQEYNAAFRGAVEDLARDVIRHRGGFLPDVLLDEQQRAASAQRRAAMVQRITPIVDRIVKLAVRREYRQLAQVIKNLHTLFENNPQHACAGAPGQLRDATGGDLAADEASASASVMREEIIRLLGQRDAAAAAEHHPGWADHHQGDLGVLFHVPSPRNDCGAAEHADTAARGGEWEWVGESITGDRDDAAGDAERGDEHVEAFLLWRMLMGLWFMD